MTRLQREAYPVPHPSVLSFSPFLKAAALPVLFSVFPSMTSVTAAGLPALSSPQMLKRYSPSRSVHRRSMPASRSHFFAPDFFPFPSAHV